MENTPMTYDNLFALFACAISHNLKFPKLRFAIPGTSETLIIKVNGSKSKHEGDIALCNDAGFGSPSSRYYGRIEKNGGLVAGRDLTPGIESFLQRIAADPIGVAAELGRASGSCCFCGKLLTDQTSASYGYGKICSVKFGLIYTTKGRARKEPVPTLSDGCPAPSDAEYAEETARIASEMLDVAIEDQAVI
jgi:hypothetical protein